jgi:hypothetical protein
MGWIHGRLLLRYPCCGWNCLRFALLPKSLGNLQRFDIQVVPPSHFVTGLLQLLMVITAEWHGELVADFKTQGARLRKSQVMRIGRLTPTDKTGLRRNESQM